MVAWLQDTPFQLVHMTVLHQRQNFHYTAKSWIKFHIMIISYAIHAHGAIFHTRIGYECWYIIPVMYRLPHIYQEYIKKSIQLQATCIHELSVK